jgi:hypothetical protein
MKKHINIKIDSNIIRKLVIFTEFLVFFLVIGSSISMACTGFLEENKSYDIHKNIVNQTEFSPKLGLAPENPKFIEYQKNKQLNQKTQSQSGHKSGFIPSPVDLSHLH